MVVCMSDFQIGFIGAGNIATAIFNGVTSSGYIKSDDVCVFDVDIQKTSAFSKKGATVVSSTEELVRKCDFVFLTVKPQIYYSVLESIKDVVDSNVCLIDVAAGISIKYIKSILGFDASVVRVMPNTPLMYGNGATALVKCAPVTNEQFNFVKGCFDACGVTCIVDEEQINTVIAVSGSAPAYVMRFAKVLIDYAVSNGLNESDAELLVTGTLIGSAKMALQSERTISDLIKMVTSPNGTTEKGLEALDDSGFDEDLLACLNATVKRAEELSK